MGVGVSIPVVRVNTPGVRLQLLPDQTAYCRLQLKATDCTRLRDAEQKARVCVDIHCRVIQGSIAGAYMAVKSVNRNDAAIAPYAPPPQHINQRAHTAGRHRPQQQPAAPYEQASQADSTVPQQRYLTDHTTQPQANGDVHLRLLPRHTDNFTPASYFLSIVGGSTHSVLDVEATIQTLPYAASDRQPATVYMNQVAYINRPHLIGDRQRILSDDAYIEQLQWRIVDLERELGQSNCSVLDSAHSLRLQRQNASLLIELDDVKRELEERRRAEMAEGELRGRSAYEERAVILQLEAQVEQYKANAKQAQARLNELEAELGELQQRQARSSHGTRWREEVELHGDGGVRAQRLIAEEEEESERRRLRSRQEAERYNQQHRQEMYESKYDVESRVTTARSQTRDMRTPTPNRPHLTPITRTQPSTATAARTVSPREQQHELAAEYRRRQAEAEQRQQAAQALQRDASHSPAVVRSANGWNEDEDEEYEVQQRVDGRQSADGARNSSADSRAVRDEEARVQDEQEQRRLRVQRQREEDDRLRHERSAEERHRAEMRAKEKEREREHAHNSHNHQTAATAATHSHAQSTTPRGTHTSPSHTTESHKPQQLEKSSSVEVKKVDNPHAHRSISAQVNEHAATHHAHTTKEAESTHDEHHHSHSHHHTHHEEEKEEVKDEQQTAHHASHKEKELEKELEKEREREAREKERDREKERERERERENEREKEREKIKEKERELEKEQEREREKEKKEREREQTRLKEKEESEKHHSHKAEDEKDKQDDHHHHHHEHHHHSHHSHSHKHDSDADKAKEKETSKEKENEKGKEQDEHHHSHSHSHSHKHHEEEEKTNDASHSHSANVIQTSGRQASSRKLAPIASSSDKKKARDVDDADEKEDDKTKDKHHHHHNHTTNSHTHKESATEVEVEMEI